MLCLAKYCDLHHQVDDNLNYIILYPILGSYYSEGLSTTVYYIQQTFFVVAVAAKTSGFTGFDQLIDRPLDRWQVTTGPAIRCGMEPRAILIAARNCRLIGMRWRLKPQTSRPADTRRWINVGLTLDSVKPTLIQRLVSAGSRPTVMFRRHDTRRLRYNLSGCACQSQKAVSDHVAL